MSSKELAGSLRSLADRIEQVTLPSGSRPRVDVNVHGASGRKVCEVVLRDLGLSISMQNEWINTDGTTAGCVHSRGEGFDLAMYYTAANEVSM